MGFNNGGLLVVYVWLVWWWCRGIVGVNVGVNKDIVDWVGDYVVGVMVMVDVVDYLMINILLLNMLGLCDL